MFVRAPNPFWFLTDLTGLPLNDGDYVFFLTNVFPYLPQPVFQDNQGLSAWPDPLEVGPDGNLPNNLYFNPQLVYRIEVRAGPTQDNLLLRVVENFVPGSSGITPVETISNAENQVSNPQFAFINFSSPDTITVAGTYNIAPDWNLILTGTGSTTITQNIFSGSENIIGNPPFALKINNNGWSSSILQQTFNGNGALWSNEAVATSITILAEGVNQPITISYNPSEGESTVIASGTALTSGYTQLQGAVAILASTNTNLSPSAFVNFNITLPPTGIVDITNVQLVGEALPLPITLVDETIERQLDHLFHYYANELITKPKNSLLTGWNFPQNPYQFRSPAVSLVSSQCAYVADQTIIYQQTNGSIAAGQASVTNGGGLQVQPQAGAGATATRFALIQYIDPKTIEPYWGNILSSLVRARIFTTGTTSVPLKMRLLWRNSLPPTLSPTDPIASWSGTDPVFATGWTAISPNNDPAFILPNSFSSFEGVQGYPGFSFDQFNLPAQVTANDTLAIVLYVTGDMLSSISDFIVFDRVSLVPNKFAVDSNPETFDEVYRKCQFYFQKSYQYNVLPGTATTNGEQTTQQFIAFTGGGGVAQAYPRSFLLTYQQTMRSSPAIVFYAPSTGAQNGIEIGIYFNSVETTGPNNITNAAFTLSAQTPDFSTFLCTETSTPVLTSGSNAQGQEALLQYQYTLDARLGV